MAKKTKRKQKELLTMAEGLAKVRSGVHKPTMAIPNPKLYDRKKDKAKLRKETADG